MVESRRDSGLYRPEFEHDACGVGVIANMDGRASHDVVSNGLEVLVNLAHRGAQGSDPKTGDGAGMLLQIPDRFFRAEASRLGIELPLSGQYAVGMVFFPREPALRSRCQAVFEEVVRQEGQILAGWRDVPTDPKDIGEVAKESQPFVCQAFVARGPHTTDQVQFERALYLIRKTVEKRVTDLEAKGVQDFYVCSLSSKQIVYKGLLLGTQLRGFYPDLRNSTVVSAFVLVHSRFSTNTLGSWKLAHPYRFIVHNGEINTLRGNINWMVARQGNMASRDFGNALSSLFPVITPGASDTASLDNAIELLLATGRSIEHVMAMLIPEATGDMVRMSQEKRAFYEYHAGMMEPWDGPALVAFTDGVRVGAVLDRNGLRPFRYLVTKQGLLVMASEVGVLAIPEEDVVFKARLEPGRMFLLDPARGGIVDDATLKASLASRQPYTDWLATNRLVLKSLPDAEVEPAREPVPTPILQRAFGYTQEDLLMLMAPMATNGAEPTGSMGNDTPLAVFSNHPQILFNYFKQLFAQVSNPPLDAIREELVTSTAVLVGPQKNIFEETPEHARQVKLDTPVLTNAELSKLVRLNQPGLRAITLSTLFPANAAAGEMEGCLDKLLHQAALAVERGFTLLVLSDRGVDADHMPIPSLLATAGLHHHLVRLGTRTQASIIVETGEAREISHFALLIGYGASAVNPYLAFDTLKTLTREGVLASDANIASLQKNYVKAIQKGLLKIISKMGISTVQGYCGAQIFEAVGLGRELVDKYFGETPSRIGGIGIEAIETDVRNRHHTAFTNPEPRSFAELEDRGFYYWRRGGEYHMWNPETIAVLQHAARTNDQGAYRRFAKLANEYEQQICTIRGLLDFQFSSNPIPLDQVEPASEIVKRFATGAISLGSISREAHETLAIAMNRIGARSNSGEGGEDYRRFTPDANGDSRKTRIKQVASGRFGVTTNYLVNATDLQIKMAQGAKPGEGGQLPGHKVDEYIGWVRHSTPGVELISPPPHHDIYSIEDLAELIHDLKTVNPSARIHVKLVSEVGVGTIAAGVSKAKADVVLISGDSGGTGASPEASIKHAGLPWELGLAETQQVLVRNNLRGRITVQVDGQIKTGRDVAIACLLGADEFGIATAALITMGCVMLRKCHLNTCSVGIATQDPELRARFAGQPEHVINYFFLVAEELREIMAKLGFRTVREMIGRVDRLKAAEASANWRESKGVDLSPLLFVPQVSPSVAISRAHDQDHHLDESLDHTLIAQSHDALESKEPVEFDIAIRNSNRAVGAMLSGEIAKRFGEVGLPDDTIRIQFQGSAGQSFGAFLAKGVTFTLQGDANDYFGKGVSGGRLIVVPPAHASYVPEDNIIVGNVVLYGSTGGEVFIRGRAGERFAVRNSGAHAVVEGVGDHGCEYMTNGRVVVLGLTGRNFAAGMSGGIAYVLDEAGDFAQRCNQDMVDLEKVVDPHDQQELLEMIQNHQFYTGSATAKRVLQMWDRVLPKFVKVYPKDYRRVVESSRRTEKEE